VVGIRRRVSTSAASRCRSCARSRGWPDEIICHRAAPSLRLTSAVRSPTTSGEPKRPADSAGADDTLPRLRTASASHPVVCGTRRCADVSQLCCTTLIRRGSTTPDDCSSRPPFGSLAARASSAPGELALDQGRDRRRQASRTRLATSRRTVKHPVAGTGTLRMLAAYEAYLHTAGL